MAFQFSDSDRDILISIAEHRVLTTRHLSILLRRNANALRRRLKILRMKGLIEIASRPFGRNRGRPESLISLAEAGVGLLQTRAVVDLGLRHCAEDARNCAYAPRYPSDGSAGTGRNDPQDIT